MGKPRTLSGKAKRLAKRKGIAVKGSNPAKEPSESPPMYAIDVVLGKATDAMEVYDYELAKTFCQRALEMDNDNVRALETTSTLLLEVGDVESAKQCLGRAIAVAPSSGHTKYLSMAQILEGNEALELYRKGIDILKEEIRADSRLKKELSSAYCAVAELFMTDLCDLEQAESKCAECIRSSIEADESNPEAWQTQARLHLVRSEFEHAKSSMRKCLDLWLPGYNAVVENRAEQGDFDPVDVCPVSFGMRLAAAKILIELEEWEDASQVLDSLVEEDEDAVEVWYLMGWTNKLRADLDDEDSYKSHARLYLEKALSAHNKVPTDDEQLVSHVKELLEELGDEDEEANDDDWEDCASSKDGGMDDS